MANEGGSPALPEVARAAAFRSRDFRLYQSARLLVILGPRHKAWR